MTQRKSSRGSAGRRPSPRRYPREARLSELIWQIVAEELERIADERLELVTITSVDCDPDLHWALIYFSSLRGPEADAEILDVLGMLRPRLQKAVATQTHVKRTPELKFAADLVARSAERIEEILRTTPLVGRDDDSAPAAGEIPEELE